MNKSGSERPSLGDIPTPAQAESIGSNGRHSNGASRQSLAVGVDDTVL